MSDDKPAKRGFNPASTSRAPQIPPGSESYLFLAIGHKEGEEVVKENNQKTKRFDKIYGFALEAKNVPFEPPKAEKGKPPIPVDTSVTKPVKMFDKKTKVTIFKAPLEDLVCGGVYKAAGVLWSVFEHSKPEIGTLVKTGAKQFFPSPNVDLFKLLSQVPYENVRISLEDDIYDPMNSDAVYDIDKSLDHAVLMELRSNSSLPEDSEGEWFPGQANGTICARLPDADKLIYSFIPDKDKPTEVKDILACPDNQVFQLIVNQRNPEGMDEKFSIKTKLYEQALEVLLLRNWVNGGPLLVNHLAGYIYGSTERKNTTQYFQFDASFGFQGAIFAYVYIAPNFPETFKQASAPTGVQTAFKINNKLAQRLLKTINFTVKEEQKRKYEMYAKWSNGMNLSMRNIPGYFNDDLFDYYILCNYNFASLRRFNPLDKKTDDELFTEFTENQNFQGSKRYAEIFVVSKHPGLSIDGTLQQEQTAKKNAIFSKKEKAAKVVVDEATVAVVPEVPVPVSEAPIPVSAKKPKA